MKLTTLSHEEFWGKYNGTHLRGEVAASYADLEKRFGPPGDLDGDGYKVSTEWRFEMNGKPFTLYDWKETSLYESDYPSVEEFRNRESYGWHIGSNDSASKADVEAFAAAIEASA